MVSMRSILDPFRSYATCVPCTNRSTSGRTSASRAQTGGEGLLEHALDDQAGGKQAVEGKSQHLGGRGPRGSRPACIWRWK